MELVLLPLRRAAAAALLAVACGASSAAPPPSSARAPTPAATTPAPAPATSSVAPPIADAGLPEPPAAPPAEPTPEPLPIPEGTTVLHIGDSMAGALGISLNDEFKKHKVKSLLRFQTASYIPVWAWGKELPLYLAQYKPDLVLITLGTNEVKILDPNQRIPLIKKLVGKLDGRPCVWIAPPVWTHEKGLYQVIRDNIAPCRYMDTQEVYPDMPRLKDKVHPTDGARKVWAKKVVEWLARERRPTPDQPWALAPEPSGR